MPTPNIPPKLIGQLHFCDLNVANMPLDVLPSGVPYGNRTDPWDDYGANGTLLHDTLSAGLRASGHHTGGYNNVATALIDLNSIAWAWRNADTTPHLETQVDAQGIFPGGAPSAPHGYHITCEVPVAWGGHPDFLVMGTAASTDIAFKIDSTQATLGFSTFIPPGSGLGAYFSTGGYIASSIWRAGQGWFYVSQTAYNAYTLFIDRFGSIADRSYPSPVEAYSSNALAVDERHQLLMGMNGGNFYYYSDVTRPRNHFYLGFVDLSNPSIVPSKPIYFASVIGETADRPSFEDGLPTNDLEKGCPAWCPQRDCYYMFDVWHGYRMLRVRPPATGDRKTANWTSEEITAVHWSAGDPSGSPTLRQAFNPGSSTWISLIWVDEWDCFLLPAQFGFPPQLIRPPDGGGPDPAAAPTPPPAATALQYGLAPTSGVAGVPSTMFTVGANGSITGTVVVTPGASPSGTFTPSTVSINTASPVGSFTFTPGTTGAYSLTLTNDGALTNPSARTYTASAAPPPPPPPPGTRTVSITIKTPAGVLMPNMTNLSWASFDQATPDQYLAPTDKGATATSNSSAVLALSLPNSALASGGVCSLIVCDATGVPFFNGPVPVV